MLLALAPVATRWTAMKNLNKEICRLGEVIGAVEAMLAEAYGLTPVTPAVAAELGSAWARRLRALYQRAWRPLASMVESGDLFPVRAPQPD